MQYEATVTTIQDRIVQSALKMLLEPLYEQDFCNSSHGFRPKRSCMTALRDVAYRYPRSTWVIEGDITGCYDNIDHGRLMSLLRKRVRDEKLLGIIFLFLKAGYLENWKLNQTYSGTPQGGVLSPLLANIYLHELDKFAENSLRANAKESQKESNARRSPEYRRIDKQIARLRIRLAEPDLNGVLPGMASPRAQIAKRLKKLEKARKAIPSHKTQKRIGYVRYADDYLITLQQYSKAEAEELKVKIGQFLKTHLGLEQNVEKTLITHPTKKAKYLGYDLRSGGGRSKRVRLEIPKGARDDLLERTGRLCRLHHIDETDLILKVSDSVRGWMNYYRYASAPQRVFSITKLSPRSYH